MAFVAPFVESCLEDTGPRTLLLRDPKIPVVVFGQVSKPGERVKEDDERGWLVKSRSLVIVTLVDRRTIFTFKNSG